MQHLKEFQSSMNARRLWLTHFLPNYLRCAGLMMSAFFHTLCLMITSLFKGALQELEEDISELYEKISQDMVMHVSQFNAITNLVLVLIEINSR